MIENMERILAETKEIVGERIRLRRFSLADVADVLAYGGDPQAMKYLVWNGISTLEEAAAAITDVYMPRSGSFAIALKESGRCIGTFELRPDPKNEKAGFGYVLNREFWNQGYMTKALRLMLRFCFETLELNRVESTHYVGNEGSGRVMEKAGMKQEGFAPQEVKVKGVFYDVVHYGILRADYRG